MKFSCGQNCLSDNVCMISTLLDVPTNVVEEIKYSLAVHSVSMTKLWWHTRNPKACNRIPGNSSFSFGRNIAHKFFQDCTTYYNWCFPVGGSNACCSYRVVPAADRKISLECKQREIKSLFPCSIFIINMYLSL